jgi:hypothetical protein
MRDCNTAHCADYPRDVESAARRTAMPKKAKPAAKPKAAQHPLVGKFFHSLEADKKTINWQGTVKAEVAPGLLLVQLFEWIVGGECNQIVVPVADMTYWPIYDSAEEMTEAYKHYSARKKHKHEDRRD